MILCNHVVVHYGTQTCMCEQNYLIAISQKVAISSSLHLIVLHIVQEGVAYVDCTEEVKLY